MRKGFQHILVPVYPTLDAESAVKKATEWSNEEQAEIQLVNMPHLLSQFKASLFGSVAAARLQERWIEKLQQLTTANINCYHHTGENSGSAILSSIALYQPDLVVMAANRTWWPLADLLSAARVATTAGVPVLQLKRGHKKTTSIVVPVKQGVHNKTLEQISVISKKNEVDVHLVAYKQEAATSNEEIAPMGALQAYQWLKSYVKCPVEFSRVTGTSETKAVIDYLHRLKNDVLLLR
jgi:hypothetical protein